MQYIVLTTCHVLNSVTGLPRTCVSVKSLLVKYSIVQTAEDSIRCTTTTLIFSRHSPTYFQLERIRATTKWNKTILRPHIFFSAAPLIPLVSRHQPTALVSVPEAVHDTWSNTNKRKTGEGERSLYSKAKCLSTAMHLSLHIACQSDLDF
jgi:hypothetical protein